MIGIGTPSSHSNIPRPMMTSVEQKKLAVHKAAESHKLAMLNLGGKRQPLINIQELYAHPNLCTIY